MIYSGEYLINETDKRNKIMDWRDKLREVRKDMIKDGAEDIIYLDETDEVEIELANKVKELLESP